MPLTEIPDFDSIGELNLVLKEDGCRRCDLGFQPNINGCCVSRGTSITTKMIIGEAPGKDEDSTRMPFTGPAGRLMDRIWASVDMDTNDWYLTNTVLCRPIAPSGHGKQNLTPKPEQRSRCRPFFDLQIALVQPRIIVTVGAVATAAILRKPSVRMGDYRGRAITNIGIMIQDDDHPEQVTVGRPLVFPMLHPAAILHAKRDPEKHALYRQQMWDDIQNLKRIIDAEGL